MSVVGYFPATGQITQVMIQNSYKKYQVVTRAAKWFVSENWVSKASADHSLKGFVPVSPAQDFDSFIKTVAK